VIPASLVLGIAALADRQMADKETAVTLEQVPDAVKATILAEAQGGTIQEIERENEDGQAIYEADVLINGRKVELKVTQDGGKLIRKEAGDEEANDDED
jgi:uncharacterized membrane protein YkoI